MNDQILTMKVEALECRCNSQAGTITVLDDSVRALTEEVGGLRERVKWLEKQVQAIYATRVLVRKP